MTEIEPETANAAQSPANHAPGLTSAELYHSLTWLFGLIALFELAIIFKLLLEGSR